MKITIYGKWSEQSKAIKGLLISEKEDYIEQCINRSDSEVEAEYNITGVFLKKITDKSYLDSNYRNVEIVSNLKNAVALINKEYEAMTSRGKAFNTFVESTKKIIDFTAEYIEVSEQELDNIFKEKFKKKSKEKTAPVEEKAVETKEMKRGFRKIVPKPTFSDIKNISASSRTYTEEEEKNFRLIEYAMKKYAGWSDSPELFFEDILKAGNFTCLECTVFKPNGFAEMTVTEFDLMKDGEKVNPQRKLEMLYIIDYNYKRALTEDRRLEVVMTTEEESRNASLIPFERRIALRNILPVERCRAGEYLDITGYNDKKSRIEAIIEECKQQYGEDF